MVQFDLAEVLAAIESTSAAFVEFEERIAALEAANYRAGEENTKLRSELSDLITTVRSVEADAEAHRHAADQNELAAAAYIERADVAQRELTVANNHLAEIGKAVSALRSMG